MEEGSEHSQRFHFNRKEENRVVSFVRNFNSSEFKEHIECTQRLNFNSREVKGHSVCRQRFPFSSSEVKQRSGIVRYCILIVVRKNSILRVVRDFI